MCLRAAGSPPPFYIRAGARVVPASVPEISYTFNIHMLHCIIDSGGARLFHGFISGFRVK
jgi:hypothetical protein